MTLLATLIHMHTYRRPSGSATERAFIAAYVATLPNAYVDEYHNWHVVIGDSRILWSCHTDTVHRVDGMQTLHYDAATGVLGLSRKAKAHGSNCLGADDTAGVFICAQMVLAGIPGHYVFHHGEECGGIGSGDLSTYERDMLGRYDYAIAFDRRGTTDIVTHQRGMRTASDLFALSLAEALEAAGLPGYAEHDGVYTDTAEYADIIAECSNLSVGYAQEHSPNEMLNTQHTLRLLNAMLRLDQSALVADRDPSTFDEPWQDYLSYDLPIIDAEMPAHHFCLVCDERVNPLVEHDCIGHATWFIDCPACGENQEQTAVCCQCGYDMDAQNYYLDAAYADIQKALQRSALDPTDIATWKRNHRKQVS